jgi:SAM-dependent methyltransferase
MTDPVRGYDKRAAVFVHQYEQLDPESVHGSFLDYLPEGAGRLVLDIGAGSGRDAAWLRRKGFEVVAVEPSPGMRIAGQSLHPDPLIRWVDDRLPSLAATHRLGLAFDVILLSGVLMHVTPGDRPRAFRKVASLLKPGGVLLISVRDGAGESDRPMWLVSRGEVEGYARTKG